jgi:hypothetical protein
VCINSGLLIRNDAGKFIDFLAERVYFCDTQVESIFRSRNEAESTVKEHLYPSFRAGIYILIELIFT